MGVPYTNLVQFSSVQFFNTSLGLEREQYYRQPVLNQDLPGGPWRSLKVPWTLPDTNLVQSVQFSCSLEGPWKSLEAPWRLPGDPWKCLKVLQSPWRVLLGILKGPGGIPGASLGGP